MENKGKKRVVSGVLIYTIFLLLSFLSVKIADAATLGFSPLSDKYSVGDEVLISINISSPDQAINAISGVFSFPSDKLELISLSKDNSIFNFWIKEPSFSNASGTVNFEGIIFNPSFKGEIGRIVNLTFKVKAIGQAKLRFSSGAVLANDGLATDVLKSKAEKKLPLTK